MKLASLSSGTFSPFGSLLKARPEDGNFIKESLCLNSSDNTIIYRSSCPTVIDYSEGMTVLTVFEEERQSCFYLDRTVRLKEGIAFSLFPLEDSSSAVLLHSPDAAISKTEGSPLPALSEEGRSGIERIFTLFYQETSENFYFRGEAHSAYELVYVDQGSLHNIINGHDYVVSQQECIIIDRNQWHIQYSDPAVKFLTVSFSHRGEELNSITDRTMRVPAGLLPVLTEIIAEKSEYPLSDEYLKALVQIFLICLIRCPEAQPLSVKAPSTAFCENALVAKALKRISEGISGKIALSTLAEELHISLPYLYRLFDQHLNMPPGRYIMKIRLEESKMLLREGRKNISEVAKDCGFTSVQHYSRQFRRHFQQSPSEYVRSLR